MNLLISGAGYSAANGELPQVADFNGYDAWDDGTICCFLSSEFFWLIADSSVMAVGTGTIYYSVDGSAAPESGPPESGWAGWETSDYDPAPTVQQVEGGGSGGRVAGRMLAAAMRAFG